MATDYSHHGQVLETSRVDVYVDEAVPNELRGEIIRNAERRLHSMARRMPHAYWATVAR